jgi:hypothetical protein
VGEPSRVRGTGGKSGIKDTLKTREQGLGNREQKTGTKGHRDQGTCVVNLHSFQS